MNGAVTQQSGQLDEMWGGTHGSEDSSGNDGDGIAVDGKPGSDGFKRVKVPRCNGKVATIVGSSDDDTLRGTPEADVIVGTAGDDTISSLSGSDTVCGVGGNDILKGGAGADFFYAGRGFDDNVDEVRGQRGNDTIFGGTGWIVWSADVDVMR